MARLIDADALWRKFENGPWYDNADRDEIALPLVDDAPTVDAVEVVRCRDCKRCYKHTTKRNRQKMWICMRNDFEVCVRPYDFCSYGERRTDG